MPDRTLTIRGVPDAVLKRLRSQAGANRRSLNSELLVLLERAAEVTAADDDLPAPGRHASAVREARPSYGTAVEPDASFDIDGAALAAACQRHHIRRLELFGSLAEGRARPDSDADVIADFEPGRTPGFDIVRIAEALRPLFGGRQVHLFTSRELRRLRRHGRLSIRTLYAAE